MIATCSELPALDPDDRLLAAALGELGVRAVPAVWTDVSVDWSSAPICVVRSTWDYHKRPLEFADWVDNVARKTAVFNHPDAIHWNSHKFYLRALEREGVPIVPTMWLERGSAPNLNQLLDEREWLEGVIKPAYGASADGILRVGPRSDDRNDAERYLHGLLEEQDVLLQPYLSTLSAHYERALVFIGGRYSHAVAKFPFMHANSDLSARASRPPGASGELPVSATTEEIALGCQALKATPHRHVFARVDVVRYRGVASVMELELIEPTLYLYAFPGAARSLAKEILDAARSPRPERLSTRSAHLNPCRY